MTQETTLGLIGISTFIIGTISLVLLRPLLQNLQIVDVPNYRSSHEVPTLRGGGIGILVAILVGLAIAAAIGARSNGLLPAILWLGLVATSMASIGWVEDCNGLSVRARLGGQIIIACWASLALSLMTGLPAIVTILIAGAGVIYVNAANFMDGVNGLSGMHGVTVGAYFVVVGLMEGLSSLSLGAAVIAAAFLSFLPWNAPKARMFMGDVGSYALGATVWALGTIAISSGISIFVSTAPLTIYVGDVFLTILRRARRREPLFDSHREHVYQRIQQSTKSHQAAAAATTGATLACAIIGLWYQETGQGAPVIQSLLILAIFVIYAIIPALVAKVLNRSVADDVESASPPLRGEAGRP